MTSVPWVSNAGVVGSVMPRASPTADQRRPGELEPSLQAGEVERIERACRRSSSRARPMVARSDRGCACASAPSARKPSTPAVRRSMRHRQLPVLADRLQAQAAFAGREAHARRRPSKRRRGAAGANEDAAARRAARRATAGADAASLAATRPRAGSPKPRRAALPSLSAKRASMPAGSTSST